MVKNKFKIGDEVIVLDALNNNGGWGIIQSVRETEDDYYLVAMNRSYSLSKEDNLKLFNDENI